MSRIEEIKQILSSKQSTWERPVGEWINDVDYLIRVAEAGLNLWYEVDLCGAASIDAHFGIADIEDAFSKFQKALEGDGE